MAEEVKKFKVTGGAAEDYATQLTGGRRKRGTRRVSGGGVVAAARPVAVRGGGGAGLSAAYEISTPPQVKLAQVTGTSPPNAPFTQALNPVAPRAASPSAPPSVPPSAPSGQAGGAKPKVILAPPKKSKPASKIILAPRKSRATTAGHHQTRKIRVALSGMRKRMTRAKKIYEDSEKKGVGEIRKALVEAKLIKDGSKVPEDLLRAMYKDYLLLKERAL